MVAIPLAEDKLAAHYEDFVKITPVILAGGRGERLWPLSTHDVPKQFLLLSATPTSLFQDAALRVADRNRFTAPLILCNALHRPLVLRQLHALGIEDADILVEPVGRNTAPALALAALHCAKHFPSRLLLVLPSDHRITDRAAFIDAVMRGAPAARNGHVVTFAAAPQGPETGYGYIRYGTPLPAHRTVHTIGRFVEKPTLDALEALLAAGGVGVNCGIFLLQTETALAALQHHAPRLLSLCRAAYTTGTHEKCLTLPDAAPLAECPAISIDHAIMEHTAYGAVVPVAMGWSDMGSYAALGTQLPIDSAGNRTHGISRSHDSHGCDFYAQQNTLVATIGLADMLVVATGNAVLVVPKDRLQDMPRLLQQLPAPVAAQMVQHPGATERPWGRFYLLGSGTEHQVKRLHINAGCKISLQSHQHRSEHWVVAQGRATVTQNGATRVLEKNQSTYIPAGAVHRLENHEQEELIIIEVQTGEYLGEDDIIRFEDCYDRQ